MRRSDSSRPIPPTLRCLRVAVPSEHLRLRSVGRQVLRPRPRAVGEPVPASRQSLGWRRRGLPGSRETHPHACHALRPRRGRCFHGHSAAAMWPSAQRKTSALALSMHFGAQSRGLRAPCERFAPWVTPGPRITRFRLAAGLGRMGLDTHRVSDKVSKITSGHLVPLDRASPGTREGASAAPGRDRRRARPALAPGGSTPAVFDPVDSSPTPRDGMHRRPNATVFLTGATQVRWCRKDEG